MTTPLVQLRVEHHHSGRWLSVLKIGGVEFHRVAPDEEEAARVVMEVQGSFESRLGVEFDTGTSTPQRGTERGPGADPG